MSAPATTRSAPRREARAWSPLAIGFAVVTGLAWLFAYMLWIILIQVIDYATYDRVEAAALSAWVTALTVAGFGALVVTVVLRVRRSTA